MRNIALLLIAVTIVITSCKREKQDITSPLSPLDSARLFTDTSYIISGVNDLKMPSYGIDSLNLSAHHTDGIQRRVKLSLSGLPENARSNFTTQSGYTPFNTQINMKMKFVKPGTYPLTLTAVPDIGNTKTFNVNLRVEEMEQNDCDALFAYNQLAGINLYDDKGTRLYNFASYLTYDYQIKRIYLLRLLLSADQHNTLSGSYVSTDNINVGVEETDAVQLSINCNDGTLTIPPQSIRGIRQNPRDTLYFNVSGSGKINVENNTYDIIYKADAATYKLTGNLRL